MHRIMRRRVSLLLLAALTAVAATAQAEQCLNAREMDAGARSTLERAALQAFGWASKGDLVSLRGSANATLTADFSGLEAAVRINQPILQGGAEAIRATYLLDSSSGVAQPHNEFLCGVYGTPQYVSFSFDRLPASRYGLVIEDAKSEAGNYYVTFIFQQESAGGPWKLAGFPTPAPAQALGHDAGWYLSQARAYKGLGQIHNAWLFYQQARKLAAPLPFMMTTPMIKLAREAQQSMPQDLPVEGPVTFAARSGKSYQLTQAFPVTIEEGLDLVVKYSAPDISNVAAVNRDNLELIQSMVSKLPELRSAFQAVVARAVDPQGREYGTLQSMKEIPTAP